MEQFITGDIWKEVNKLFKKQQNKIACIAYVTSTNLMLTKGDILICDASDYEIKFGSTSAKALKFYFDKGVQILSNSVLHSKLLLTNSFLVIGSGNLSNRSETTLIESAIVTNNDILLSQAKSFCYNLMRDSSTIILKREHIDRILKIKVIKRPNKPSKSSRIRNKKFGNAYWYLTLWEMSDKSYEKVEGKIESSKRKVVEKTGIKDDALSSIYFRKTKGISSLLKEGDQIMIDYRMRDKISRHIYPFQTILRIDRENDETIIIHDENINDVKYSFAKFLSLIKKLDLEKPFNTPRKREFSAKDATLIKTLWK